MANYSKHKERSPKDTVFEIKSILHRAGLFPVVEWTAADYEGARSNRVTLFPSSCGTNGKGTDALYASASGYAELMERMQNGLLAPREIRPAVAEACGYFCCPDEKLLDTEALLGQNSEFLLHLFQKFGLEDELEQRAFLRQFALEGRDDEAIPSVPFANPGCQRIEWLPFALLLPVVGSNGMAAGNTLPEAMVQALSEIFERYVNIELIYGRAVPPEIPEEYLKPYSIWNLVEQIQADGRYQVSVRDPSLGKGRPVVATVITDKKRGCLGVKVASHPSFAVAVERTLTEALQGKNMEKFTSLNCIGTLEESGNEHNWVNELTIGLGFYPAKFLAGEPDWEFKPWTEWEGIDSNEQFLRKMLSLLEAEGKTPLFRDASHLGFPACFILIPGMSEGYPTTERYMRCINTTMHLLPGLRHFPNLSGQDEERLLRLIRYRDPTLLGRKADVIFRRPLRGKRMTTDRIGGFLALKKGDFELSRYFFRKLQETETEKEETLYLKAMMEYLRYRQGGVSHDAGIRLMDRLFPAGAAKRVAEETADPATVMERLFPHMKCYDCEHCELSGKECGNRVEEEIFKKFFLAMKDTKVSQEKLLEKMTDLLKKGV